MVPPAAIGAICAAAVIVVGFICFKLAYGIWKKRQYSRERTGGSAHESTHRSGQEHDPEAFEPPPTYAQCVNNPAYMPQDVFKPPEAPGEVVTARTVQPSGSSDQHPPPSYERILSGEFKELSLADQLKIARGQSISTEFSVDHIPKELRPNRSRTDGSTVDSNHAFPETSNPVPQQNSELSPSIFMTSSSQPTGHINVGFTNDEFDEILSAMQSTETFDTSHTSESIPETINRHNVTNGSTIDRSGAYTNSGFSDSESLDPDEDSSINPIGNAHVEVSSPTNSRNREANTNEAIRFHLSQMNDINETTI